MRFLKVFILKVNCLLLFPTLSYAKLEVVTTTTSLASLAHFVGGDKINVSSLTLNSQDPHYVEAKPSYMVKVRNADLVVSVGLELEIGWLENVLRGAKKPELQVGKSRHLTAGDFIKPIEIPNGKIDRADGDVHALGNPHFMIDPMEAVKVVAVLAKKFEELDPENSSLYKENSEKFAARVKIEYPKWKLRMSNTGISEVVTYHKTFNYFLNSFGVIPVAQIEPKPGVPPTAKHIVGLIELIRNKKIKCILNESYFETTPALRLQKETGVDFKVVNAEVEGDYFIYIDNFINQFESCGVKSGSR
jgi:zinc/manganese transport system substrate-binding protein